MSDQEDFSFPHLDKHPLIDASAFIAKNATVIGNVSIGSDTSVWYGCVIRGDVERIVIGSRCNIQDRTVIHVSSNGAPTIIGDDVTVGHSAVLHACTVQSGAFVGIGATALDGAVIESESMLAAGALLTPNKVVGKGELWAGNPARFVRQLRESELRNMKLNASRYVALSHTYMHKFFPSELGEH